MSWSTGASNISRDEIDKIESPNPLLGEPADQLDAAKEAAKALIDSGVIGDPATHRFNVSLSGHANAQHEPAPGYANDVVSLSVSQATAEQRQAAEQDDEAPAQTE